MNAAPTNTRAGKHAMLYDGHARRAGVAAHDKAMRWRRLRRRFGRWLREALDG